MDSTSSQTSAADVSHIFNKLFDFVEKRRTELQKKDEELEQKRQENQKLSAKMDSAMARANQVDELKTELASQKSLSTLTSTTMDSTSQTSADDIIGVFSEMEMAKKLMIQKLEENKIKLEEKIKELEANEEDMQKLLTGYECEKSGANQANAAMVEIAKKLTAVVTKQKKCLEIHKEFIDKLLIQLKEKEEQLQEKKQANESNAIMASKLALAETKQKECEEMNATLRMTLWKSFPSAHLCYYIKMPAFGYLYVDNNGYLRSSGDPQQQPLSCAGYFKFTKHSDGTFSMYSMLKEKCLHPSPSLSSFVHFSAKEKECDTVDTKFVLVFHPQDEQLGFMVDIHSLAHNSYLTKRGNDNYSYFEATSRTAPANKFLIIPVLDGNEMK